MAGAYIEGVPMHEISYDFSGWEWDSQEVSADLLRKINERTAALVASEIFTDLTLHIEVSGDFMGQAVVSSGAVESAFIYFDLAAAVAGAVEAIEANYHEKFRDQRKAETRDHLMALRDSLVALVDAVDASPLLREREDG